MRASKPELLWEPTAETKKRANITHYLEWLATRDLQFRDYEELWSWSVRELEKFWGTIWEYFDVRAHEPYSRVLSRRKMPGARWFAGAELNYAENVLREKDHEGPAMICASEDSEKRTYVSWQELRMRTSSVAVSLTDMGVKKGDRVSAYLPNIPEAVIAFLACASIGATWASCSPDFGAPSAIDRFRQIDPKVLIAVDGYRYGGKWFDRLPVLREIQNGLPTLKRTITISKRDGEFRGVGLRDVTMWQDLPLVSSEPTFEPVPFDHPLWVLYSSGTTGLPKPIVHGHGGILLEHLKVLSLHNDLGARDRFFWFTSTGWMMWNYLVSGLLMGSTIVLYDGSPALEAGRVIRDDIPRDERGIHQLLYEGGAPAGRDAHAEQAQGGRLDGVPPLEGGVPMGIWCQTRRLARLDQWGNRPLHSVRGRLPNPPRPRGGDSVQMPCGGCPVIRRAG